MSYNQLYYTAVKLGHSQGKWHHSDDLGKKDFEENLRTKM
jgi:hypothetical protein